MIFTTLKFVAFMAIVFFLYYAIPKKMQWMLLLVASYVFYAFASPTYLVFLVATTLITYLGSVFIEKNREKQEKYFSDNRDTLSRDAKKLYKEKMQKLRKLILTAVIVLLLLMLVVFKYASFIMGNVSGVLGLFGVETGEITLDLILPIGLSFYIFQSLGYCIDVYRETASAQENFFKHALYVSFFPQLLQGPISSYSELSPQLFNEHTFSYEKTVYGLQRVAWGFAKKLVIANQISFVINSVWTESGEYSGLLFWVFILAAYAFQLYADFSGYMDIAIGCSQMLGITLEENFDTPYLSENITVFWRRWHSTLGTWFRNYVFYSILRMDWCAKVRKKFKKNKYVAKLIPNVTALFAVWFMIGLWHGADWSYVVYGLFHGGIIILSQILEPLYSKFDTKFSKLSKSKAFNLIRIFRTFAIVCFGYAIFKPADLSVTSSIINQMVSGLGFGTLISFGMTNFRELFAAFVGVIILSCVDVYHFKTENSSIREKINGLADWKRWSVYALFLIFIVFLGSYGTSDLNQFEYFRF